MTVILVFINLRRLKKYGLLFLIFNFRGNPIKKSIKYGINLKSLNLQRK